MKTLAWIANLCLIAMMVWLFSKHGWPHQNEERLFVFLGFAAPTLSCLALISAAPPPQDGEESTFKLAHKALRAKLKKAAQIDSRDDG